MNEDRKHLGYCMNCGEEIESEITGDLCHNCYVNNQDELNYFNLDYEQ